MACNASFDGSTLLISGFGRSSIGQMVCDLFIYKYDFQRAKIFHMKSLPALIGSNPYKCSDDDFLATTCELYSSTCLPSMSILLVRAQPFKAHRKRFCLEISQQLMELNFSEYLILADAFFNPCLKHSSSNEQSFVSDGLSQTFFLTNKTHSSQDRMIELGLLKLEAHCLSSDVQAGLMDPNEKLQQNCGCSSIRLPDCGVTKMLFAEISEKCKTGRTTLVIHCTTGGETLACLEGIAQKLNKLITKQDVTGKFSIPPSWQKMFESNDHYDSNIAQIY